MKPITHNKKFMRQLGKRRDSELSDEFGVSRQRISQIRMNLGIRKYRDPSIAMEKRFIQSHLRELDDMTIIEFAAAHSIRHHLVMQATSEAGLTLQKRMNRSAKRLIKTVPLGEISDYEAARRLGVVSTDKIRRIRKRFHIDAFQKWRLNKPLIKRLARQGKPHDAIARVVGSRSGGSISTLLGRMKRRRR